MEVDAIMMPKITFWVLVGLVFLAGVLLGMLLDSGISKEQDARRD